MYTNWTKCLWNVLPPVSDIKNCYEYFKNGFYVLIETFIKFNTKLFFWGCHMVEIILATFVLKTSACQLFFRYQLASNDLRKIMEIVSIIFLAVPPSF